MPTANSQRPIAFYMRNFRELTIWQDGIKITKKVYLLSALLPAQEKYGLTSQICRAAVSIPSNIAEGCSRSSQKDFKHFLEIALGSAFELETQLVIIEEIEMVKKGAACGINDQSEYNRSSNKCTDFKD